MAVFLMPSLLKYHLYPGSGRHTPRIFFPLLSFIVLILRFRSAIRVVIPCIRRSKSLFCWWMFCPSIFELSGHPCKKLATCIRFPPLKSECVFVPELALRCLDYCIFATLQILKFESVGFQLCSLFNLFWLFCSQ